MTIREQFEAWDEQRKWCSTYDGLPQGPSPSDWQDSDDTGIELLREAMKLVVELPKHHPDPYHEPTNDVRAARIMPLLLAYRRAYYYHLDENGEPTEALGVVIQDMLTDTFHLADRVADTDDETEPVTADRALQAGWGNYEEERVIETLEI